jgi:hypothetical protein
MKNTKTDQFFSSRVNNSSKDNLKQVIKIYKEGLKEGNDGYASNRVPVKETNLKTSLGGNANRNFSVPRGAQ